MARVTWDELIEHLNTTTPRNLRGTYHAALPRIADELGWPPPSPVLKTSTFAFRAPNHWRSDSAHSARVIDPHDFVDKLAPMSFTLPPHTWTTAGPVRMVLGLDGGFLRNATPLGHPTAVEHDGRPAWRIGVREASAELPFLITVDRDLGIVLSLACDETGYREELSGLDSASDLADEVFTDSEAIDAVHRDWQAEMLRAVDHYRVHPFPVPTWWPGSLARPTPAGGDLSTGLVVVDLDGQHSEPPGIAGAQLSRQPVNLNPFQGGWLGNPKVYAHRWNDSQHQWSLAVTGDRPLSPDELAHVAASIADYQLPAPPHRPRRS